MPVDLRSLSRGGARTASGRTLPLAALLGAIVIVAAGIDGTAHFGGARWYPHLGGGSRRSPVPKRLKVAVPPPRQLSHHTGSSLPPTWLLLLGMIALLAAVVATLVWLWHRRRQALALAGLRPTAAQIVQQPVPAEPEPEPEALLTGIELALQVLDENREPTDAIVRAWIGLQETAAESGIVRRPAESPTEFTARILAGAFADDDALRTLLRLYLRTRFGDHPATAKDVSTVRDALAQLLSSWRAPARASQAGTRPR